MKLNFTLNTRSHSKNIFGALVTRSYWQQSDFWLANFAAVIFWLSFKLIFQSGPLTPSITTFSTSLLFLIFIFPVLEEIVFRGLVQESIQKLLEHKQFKIIFLWRISNANLLASLCFTLSHFWSHPPLWAAATLIPSLIFGYFKDKYQSLYPSIMLHIFYNLGFYLLM